VRAALERALRCRLPTREVAVTPTLVVTIDGEAFASITPGAGVVLVDMERECVKIEYDEGAADRDVAPLVADAIDLRWTRATGGVRQ
jgi:hypothetical protein